MNCKIYGSVMYPKLRVDGKLTQCLTGDRVVYIDPPSQPLPRFIRFQNFRARVFHHGQPNSEASITCSRCLQTGHHRSKCANQLVCRSCRKTGHLQNACPAAIGEKQRFEPTTPTPASSQSGDESRGEAVSRPTNTPVVVQPRNTAPNKEPAQRVTSSAPQTRSKTAAGTSTHEKGSRDRNHRAAKESAMPGKVVFEEPRSRSSSMPNLTAADQQTKLTQYWQKSSAESDESEGDSDETEENQSSVIAESMESHAKHGNTKSKGRKSRRKNTKDSNGKK